MPISTVKVIDQLSSKILFECSISQIASAYEYAANMERIGLGVTILAPTITETLCESLGLTDNQDASCSVITD